MRRDPDVADRHVFRRLPREFQDAIARMAEIARQAGADPTTCARVLRACERRRPGPAPAAPDPVTAATGRRKGRPRRGRVWRLTLPPEVERQPGAPTVIAACALSVCRGPAWMAEHLAAHGYRPRLDGALTAPGRPILFPSYFQVDDANAADRPEEWRSLCAAIELYSESRNENPISVTQADGRNIR